MAGSNKHGGRSDKGDNCTATAEICRRYILPIKSLNQYNWHKTIVLGSTHCLFLCQKEDANNIYLLIYNYLYFSLLPVPVAARSEAKALIAWTLRSRVHIPLNGMDVRHHSLVTLS
jgi:hypothetical protein